MEDISALLVDFADELMEELDPSDRDDEKNVQKGLLLFRQRMVQSVMFSGSTVIGRVQDVVPVRVKLHLDDYPMMECSCPADEVCRHGMALFFEVYSREHSVSLWMEAWRSSDSVEYLINREFGLKNHENPHSEAEPEQPQKPSVTSDSYDSWLQIVQDAYDNGLGKKDRLFPYLMNMYGQFALKEIGIHPPMNREQVGPYTVVTNVHLLEKLLNLFINSDYSTNEIEHMCRPLVHNILHNVEDAIDSFPNPRPIAFDSLLKRMALDIRELLFLEGPFRHEVLMLYWKVWEELFTRPSMRDEELLFAEKTAKMANPDSSWQVAWAFQLFLSVDLQAALNVLEKSASANFVYVYQFMEHYALNDKWQEFSKLIPFFLKHVNTFLASLNSGSRLLFVRDYINMFDNYYYETNDIGVYEQLLGAMMPYSTYNMAQFFYDSGDYTKFMEFVQLNGLTEQSINREIISTIQAEAPECLLPYYHREVASAIEKKNRQNYRLAVRYLKKLRALYKKLKQESIWESYFNKLQQDTKRLRAFQEEIARGKLIHVEIETV